MLLKHTSKVIESENVVFDESSSPMGNRVKRCIAFDYVEQEVTLHNLQEISTMNANDLDETSHQPEVDESLIHTHATMDKKTPRLMKLMVMNCPIWAQMMRRQAI